MPVVMESGVLKVPFGEMFVYFICCINKAGVARQWLLAPTVLASSNKQAGGQMKF